MTVYVKVKSIAKRKPLIHRMAFEISGEATSANALIEEIVRKSESLQDADEAVKNALLCFGDGLFRMFVNDAELAPEDPLCIKDGDEVTFIRLTMLSGRLW